MAELYLLVFVAGRGLRFVAVCVLGGESQEGRGPEVPHAWPVVHSLWPG